MGTGKHDEKKDEFVILRARGMILNEIAQSLGISQRTAERWNRDPEMRARISETKRAHLEELAKIGDMERAERMANLSKTIRQIDEAIILKDVNQIALSDLLALKLRYIRALKEEEGSF